MRVTLDIQEPPSLVKRETEARVMRAVFIISRRLCLFFTNITLYINTLLINKWIINLKNSKEQILDHCMKYCYISLILPVNTTYSFIYPLTITVLPTLLIVRYRKCGT